MSTDADWPVWRAEATSGFLLHELFDDAVLEGVVADDNQPAFKAEQINRLFESRF